MHGHRGRDTRDRQWRIRMHSHIPSRRYYSYSHQRMVTTSMSLLTPTESHAIQSFLAAMDYSDSFIAPEWNVHGDTKDQGRDSLIKATKDLMSLDAVKWGNPPNSPFDEPSLHSLLQTIPASSLLQQPSLRHIPPPSISIAPLRTVSAPSPPHVDDVPSSSSSPSSDPMSASPPTPLDYYPPQPHACKRPSQDDTQYISNKRSRPSHASSSQSTSAPPAKTALLSASQKKANHIQSEQKRRANIRKGYEALCENVPALREAIRLEEEDGNASGSGNAAAGSKGRKGRVKMIGDDGEKVDGRAGPRSENIVLQRSELLIRTQKENLPNLLSSFSDRTH